MYYLRYRYPFLSEINDFTKRIRHCDMNKKYICRTDVGTLYAVYKSY